jgi:hypothetical protein
LTPIKRLYNNLFDPWQPNVYGTATAGDIFSVSTTAVVFCAGMALLTYGIVSALTALK